MNKFFKKECAYCTHCDTPMIGIYDQGIRDTCTPCGGFSLVAKERDNLNMNAGGVDRYFKPKKDKIKTKFSL